ncbi:MAG: DUF4233 domain-containing protein [Marmoricola sp.]
MRKRLCSAILFLQAIVLGLSTPVLISVESVDKARSLWIGLGLTVACLLVAGLLRMRWAYALGWAIQVAAIALGTLAPAMYVLGTIFGVLWLTAYRLGTTIDRDKGTEL